MDRNLIHQPSPERPKTVPREVQNPSRVDINAYGSCKIDQPWRSPDELMENVKLLPQSVRERLFADGQDTDSFTEPELSGFSGPFAELVRVFEEEKRRETPEFRASEVLKGGVEFGSRILGLNLGQVLNRGWHESLLGQWEHRLKRGDDLEVIQQEIHDMIASFWRDGGAPQLSLKEIDERIAGFQEEILRLREEEHLWVQKVEPYLNIMRDQKAPAHKRKKAEEDYKRLFLTSKAEVLWHIDPQPVEFRTDIQYRIDHNQQELEKLKKLSSAVKFVESLFRKLKPRMDDADVTDMWLETFRSIKNAKMQEVFLHVLTQWLDEVGDITPSEVSVKSDAKTDKLIERFREAYTLSIDPSRADPKANVQQTQFILRAILRRLQSQATGT